MANKMNGLKTEHYFQLYLQARSGQIEYMKRHSTQFEHYLTIVMAILTLTMAGAYHLTDGGTDNAYPWFGVAGLLTVNATLSAVAIKSCDRSYRRFLEEVTIAAKLEGLFSLDNRRPDEDEVDRHPFPGDEILISKRWEGDRLPYQTAKEFVDAKMGQGVNLWTRRTMRLLCGVNLLAALFALHFGLRLITP